MTNADIPLGMPTSYRHQSLANWGFNCSCTLCSSPPAALEASDQRRERLVELHYAMEAPPESYDELVELTREFIELMRVERLETKVGEYYQMLMRIYFNFGDPDSAYRYGKLALIYSEMFADPEGGYCEGLRNDIRYLETVLKHREEKEKKEAGL